MARDDDFPVAPGTEKVDPDATSATVTPIGEGRSRKGRVSPQARRADKLSKAEAIVDRDQAKLVALIAPAAPVASGYWATRIKTNTEATLTIAENYPKVLTAILGVAEFDAWLTLGTFLAGMIVAVGVEMNAVRGDGFASTAFGVAEIWEEVEATRERLAREAGEFFDGGAGSAEPVEPPPLPGLMGELASTPAL
jgi:hypothetical protein